ncbi:hypothetical protein GCM10023213_33210 [Prosthecobacter algae]|uniref:Peptidase C39-like domain-containing protein n=1 Tax=Prosthecobacter algae TaxID=1144682 RepID=A0ABP9PBM8_9BACT
MASHPAPRCSPLRFWRTLACLGTLVLTGSLQAQQPAAPARPLDSLTGENVWQTTADQFQQHFAQTGLQWLSEKRDQARFFGPGLSLWQGRLPVTEALINFSPEGQPTRISLSIFNRGDSNSEFMTREKFEALIEAHRATIGQQLGVPSTERGKDKTTTAAAKAPSVTKDSLTANLKREENGDVLIANVPMVDQGPKGYCAVATAERVFKYYGIPVDQHEMAQVADSSSDGGTSPAKMYEALNKLEGRLRVRVRVIENWDYKTFMDMVGDYNKEAKRADKREVSAAPRDGTIYIDEIYGAMDGEVLKTSRIGRDRSGFGKFQRSITGLIDQGIPVMWGVMLGLLPEPEIPQAAGGHMRLIIGYNLKTNEFLYTDSWGAEHALKRMPIPNAYTMTTGIYYMEPMK